MRENTILFSVVMPVFNVEKYVREAIYSVINQNYQNYELILVDDGSTDSSGIICDEYAKNNAKIKTFHKKNGGLSDARNYGIKKSDGRYIVLLDSDDALEKDSLYNLENIIKENDYPKIICNRRASFVENSLNYNECEYKFDYEIMYKMNRAKQYRYLQSFKDCWLGAWLFVVERNVK